MSARAKRCSLWVGLLFAGADSSGIVSAKETAVLKMPLDNDFLEKISPGEYRLFFLERFIRHEGRSDRYVRKFRSKDTDICAGGKDHLSVRIYEDQQISLMCGVPKRSYYS